MDGKFKLYEFTFIVDFGGAPSLSLFLGISKPCAIVIGYAIMFKGENTNFVGVWTTYCCTHLIRSFI